MANIKEFKDHFILLCEGGFIAVNQADEDAASKLFKAAELLQPHHTLPKIGMGYMAMMKLELQKACKAFEEVLKQDPTNEMAQAFLGLTYSLTTTEIAKGERLLEDAVQKADDPMVKKLAETTLDFVERFIKKAPTPIQQQTENKKKKKHK